MGPAQREPNPLPESDRSPPGPHRPFQRSDGGVSQRPSAAGLRRPRRVGPQTSLTCHAVVVLLPGGHPDALLRPAPEHPFRFPTCLVPRSLRHGGDHRRARPDRPDRVVAGYSHRGRHRGQLLLVARSDRLARRSHAPLLPPSPDARDHLDRACRCDGTHLFHQLHRYHWHRYVSVHPPGYRHRILPRRRRRGREGKRRQRHRLGGTRPGRGHRPCHDLGTRRLLPGPRRGERKPDFGGVALLRSAVRRVITVGAVPRQGWPAASQSRAIGRSSY